LQSQNYQILGCQRGEVDKITEDHHVCVETYGGFSFWKIICWSLCTIL